jgi:hypothetical protein
VHELDAQLVEKADVPAAPRAKMRPFVTGMFPEMAFWFDAVPTFDWLLDRGAQLPVAQAASENVSTSPWDVPT